MHMYISVLIIIIMTAAIYAFFSSCSSDVPCAAFCDESQPATPTVRHKNCQFLLQLQHHSTSVRCPNCVTCRKTLAIQIKRHQSQSSVSPSSHVNYRYLSATELAVRLKHSQRQCRIASKHISRLHEKISKATLENGIVVDNQMHNGLLEIMCTET